MRITVKHLEGKVRIVNGLLGFPDDVAYSTPGTVALYQACGGYAVHRYSNREGGASDLMGGCHTARECAQFLSGMIAALRVRQEN